MKLFYYSLFILTAIAYASCQKSLSFEQGSNKPKDPPGFQTTIINSRYRLVAFYSDKPIDFITTDSVVKSETDLWIYVPDYLKDDDYLFTSDSTFTIYQNQVKIWSNPADSIKARYSIVTNAGQTIMNYIDYHYEPLQYKLDTFNKNNYLIYVDGPNGSKLYSKFIRL